MHTTFKKMQPEQKLNTKELQIDQINKVKTNISHLFKMKIWFSR